MARGSDCRLKASNVALPITFGVTPFAGSALAIVAAPREITPITTVRDVASSRPFMVSLPLGGPRLTIRSGLGYDHPSFRGIRGSFARKIVRIVPISLFMELDRFAIQRIRKNCAVAPTPSE
jgi:hypothetical protein